MRRKQRAFAGDVPHISDDIWAQMKEAGISSANSTKTNKDTKEILEIGDVLFNPQNFSGQDLFKPVFERKKPKDDTK